MTLIRVVLVPFWRGMPPDDFRTWFRQHGRRVGAVMIPLGITATAATMAAAVLEPDRSSKASAAATATIVAITVAVNEPANERFWSDEPMPGEETTRLLRRWTRWHDARVALGLFAAIFAARRVAH
jgi:hypothetical protein